MKIFKNFVIAGALVFGLTAAAFADQTTIQSTTTQSGTTTVTTSTTSATYIVNNDAAVVAALAALNDCYFRYDRMIMGILNHSQQIDYAAMEKHADWFFEHPLDSADRNGYLAYLEQRLHLDADQEREAARIEGHFLADAMPLWTAYQTALANAWTAYRQSQVTQVTTQTVATPPVEETTTTTVTPAPAPQVQVKSETVKTQRKFIRNTDVK